MEERVEPGANHHALGQPGEKTTADCGQDQRQSRRDAGEVELYDTRQQCCKKYSDLLKEQYLNVKIHKVKPHYITTFRNIIQKKVYKSIKK